MYFWSRKCRNYLFRIIVIFTLSAPAIGEQLDTEKVKNKQIEASKSNIYENKKIISLKNKLQQSQDLNGKSHYKNINLLGYITKYYYDNFKDKDALQWNEKALNISKEHHGENHLKTIRIKQTKAVIHFALSQYAIAKELNTNILRVLESKYGSSNQKIIKALDLQAQITNALGDFGDAKIYSERAIKIAATQFGGEDVRTLKLMTELVVVLMNLGEFELAIKKSKQVYGAYLEKYDENHIFVAKSLLILGEIYARSNMPELTKLNVEKAYKIADQYYDKNNRKRIEYMNAYASVLVNAEKYQEAMVLYHRIYNTTLSNFGDDHPLTKHIQLNIARLHILNGNYVKAEKLLNKVIKFRENNSGYIIEISGNDYYYLAKIYSILGDFKRAKSYIENAVIQESGRENYLLVSYLLLQADIYNKLNDSINAVILFKKAIALVEKIFGYHSYNLAEPLVSLASLYVDSKKYKQAKTLLLRAENIHEKSNRTDFDKMNILNAKAILYEKQGEYKKSINLYHNLLPALYSANGLDSMHHAFILYNMGKSYYYNDNIQASITLFKMAVNIIQAKRGSIQILNPKLKVSFLKFHKDIYQMLIKVLYDESRVPEALSVYRMLKEKEYLEYVRGYLDSNTSITLVPLTDSEKFWIDSYSNVVEKYKSRVKKHQKNIIGKGKKRNELTMASFENVKSKLLQLSTIKYVNNKSLSFDDSLKKENIKKRHANLYYIVSKDVLNITMITSNSIISKKINITKNDLSVKLHHFIKLMNNPRKKPFHKAAYLYDLLIKPIEQDLHQQDIKSLHFSLDGVLRYISMATLYDGKNYLVEKYNISLLSPIDNNKSVANNSTNMRIAGFGVTQALNGFSPLLAAEKELDGIIKTSWFDFSGSLNGNVYINDDFSKKSLQYELDKKVGFLHFSTHFSLNPVSLDNSYMLLGNGNKLLLSEFKNNHFNLTSIKMLTLSACETGVGTVGADGREIESFAVVSLKQGAKSVLATLWQVPDKATSELMVNIYENIHINPESKSLALASAQRKMIKNINANYRHPHYWGAFMLYEH